MKQSMEYLENKAKPIMDKLITSLSIEKPNDPVLYLSLILGPIYNRHPREA